MTWLSLLLWPLVALISVGCFTAVALRYIDYRQQNPEATLLSGDLKLGGFVAFIILVVAGLWLHSEQQEARDVSRCMDLRGNWSSGGCDLRWSQGK